MNSNHIGADISADISAGIGDSPNAAPLAARTRAARGERRAFAAAQRWEQRYWAALLPLLLGAVPGYQPALVAAFALAIWQLAHFAFAAASLRPITVQVRIAFLALLALGAWPGFWPVHALLLVGLNAMLALDYCLLTRLLWLAPWNRRGALSRELLDWALFAPPVPEHRLARQARALSAPGALSQLGVQRRRNAIAAITIQNPLRNSNA